MKEVNSIGGYFELELRNGRLYHNNAIALNLGRNALEYILLANQYEKVYVPFFTCEVVLEPFKKNNIEYEFYRINESLEPADYPVLLKGEAFLYTNYFGLKQSFVYELYKIYGSHLIVDNSQAFFAPQVNSVDTFWSARKFFGVPNGAFLNCGKVLERQIPVDYTIDIAKHLLERIDVSAEFGFSDFHKSEEYHNGREICYMSQLSYAILKNVDYDSVISSRRSNYSILDKALSSTNIFHFTMNEQDVPMAYPYFCFDENLRRKLLSEKVYVATYWPNVFDWCNENDIEYKFAKYILPLPCDQRYGEKDMDRILNIILR